ncbi:hypothetical protein SB748_35010, partial [Rhizobium sp. SIMBA_035]
ELPAAISNSIATARSFPWISSQSLVDQGFAYLGTAFALQPASPFESGRLTALLPQQLNKAELMSISAFKIANKLITGQGAIEQ